MGETLRQPRIKVRSQPEYKVYRSQFLWHPPLIRYEKTTLLHQTITGISMEPKQRKVGGGFKFKNYNGDFRFLAWLDRIGSSLTKIVVFPDLTIQSHSSFRRSVTPSVSNPGTETSDAVSHNWIFINLKYITSSNNCARKTNYIWNEEHSKGNN